MNAKTLNTLRRTAQTAAAALVALCLPQAAIAADVDFGAGIAAAQRLRAADNGSADVAVAAPARRVAANTALGATDTRTADLRYPGAQAAELRYPGGQAAELRFPGGQAAELRFPGAHAAELRFPGGHAAELRFPGRQAAELRFPGAHAAE